jgi:hypothetical protein
MEQCSGATGISKEMLKMAKARNCPGFIAHYVDWDLVGPWIKKNEELLKRWEGIPLADLKKAKLQEEIENKRLDNQQMRGDILSPDEVKQFLIAVGVSESAIMKKWPAELAPKLVGKAQGEIEATLTNAIVELMNLYKVELDKFLKKS